MPAIIGKVLSLILALWATAIIPAYGGDELSRRLSLVGGASVHLHINSLNSYQQGMELHNWTRVRLFVGEYEGDFEGTQPSWELVVFADNQNFLGDYGHDLDLDYLTLSAQSTDAGINVYHVKNISILEEAPSILASGVGSGIYDVVVSYHIGKEENFALLGEFPDYYFNQLTFILTILDPNIIDP